MELLRRLNQTQQSRRFKVIASIIAAALVIGAFIVLFVMATGPDAKAGLQARLAERSGAGIGIFDRGPIETIQTLVDSALVAMQTTPGKVGIAVFTGVILLAALGAIWLGLGLSYLILLLIGLAVGWPLAAIDATGALGRIILGMVPLSIAFLLLLQLARFALGAPHPVFAVARNLLQEAVRMKISVVFIVLMIIMLAVIPTLLSPDQPLRYRVQQWLQYGTGLTFLVLALMTVFFATATVTYEQRDRVIWQTMTKPVRAWHFLAGKWLGILVLNAVLLAVSSMGVFQVTEYLRRLPAQGEVYYYMPENQSIPVTQDRDALEKEVLVARRSRFITPREFDPEKLSGALGERIANVLSNNPELSDTPKLREQLLNEIVTSAREQERSIPRGQYKEFTFKGLPVMREGVEPDDLTLRFNANAGSNDPTAQYRLQFMIGGVIIPVQAGLDVSQVIPVDPSAVEDDGTLRIAVFNEETNQFSVSFPPDGLEILYGRRGYEMNFLRVVLVMWLKLCFIGAVAIACSTFVSFPVAILITGVVFFAAESAAYLNESLEFFRVEDDKGGIDILRWVSYHISAPIARSFRVYSSLRPTANLVDGRLVPWAGVGKAAFILFMWSGVVMALGLIVFRRRELATYSGR
ncbi:MAG: hypothetical protein KDA16_03995 [Phycisphaerales bacterium]|nr:hypothetical protein [Phycisphaerales bacterium]